MARNLEIIYRRIVSDITNKGGEITNLVLQPLLIEVCDMIQEHIPYDIVCGFHPINDKVYEVNSLFGEGHIILGPTLTSADEEQYDIVSQSLHKLMEKGYRYQSHIEYLLKKCDDASIVLPIKYENKVELLAMITKFTIMSYCQSTGADLYSVLIPKKLPEIIYTLLASFVYTRTTLTGMEKTIHTDINTALNNIVSDTFDTLKNKLSAIIEEGGIDQYDMSTISNNVLTVNKLNSGDLHKIILMYKSGSAIGKSSTVNELTKGTTVVEEVSVPSNITPNEAVEKMVMSFDIHKLGLPSLLIPVDTKLKNYVVGTSLQLSGAQHKLTNYYLSLIGMIENNCEVAITKKEIKLSNNNKMFKLNYEDFRDDPSFNVKAFLEKIFNNKKEIPLWEFKLVRKQLKKITKSIKKVLIEHDKNKDHFYIPASDNLVTKVRQNLDMLNQVITILTRIIDRSKY